MDYKIVVSSQPSNPQRMAGQNDKPYCPPRERLNFDCIGQGKDPIHIFGNIYTPKGLARKSMRRTRPRSRPLHTPRGQPVVSEFSTSRGGAIPCSLSGGGVCGRA